MNKGKKLNLEAFKQTLDELKGKSNITEIMFRDLWLEKIKNIPSLTINGWYVPPPEGIAVLFASDTNTKRINFESLRKPENWPTNNEIDWNHGLLFAYSSFVDIETGILGDFDITLYFGNDTKIINHFKLCYKATKEVMDQLKSIDSSKLLFQKSQEIFSKYGLKNSIISVSDLLRLDLGHSVPVVNLGNLNNRVLTNELIEEIKNGRKFISDHSDWIISDEEQFTIEPQLVSVDNPELPQVCFHYLIKKNKDGGVIIMNENDALLREYGLLD